MKNAKRTLMLCMSLICSSTLAEAQESSTTGIKTVSNSNMMKVPERVHTPTLCKPNEEVIFSCVAGMKTISLCASADASASTGHLIYRFGKIGHAVEMEYPQDTTPPGQAFKFASDWAPKGGTEQLVFVAGNYTYTLYSSHWAGSAPEELSGVLVEAGAKRIADIRCTDPVSQLGLHYVGVDKFHFVPERYIGLPSANIRPDVPYVRGDAP